ncbi:MAG: glycosyltransferase family 2 protein [Microcystaceae cyanobacterium]
MKFHALLPIRDEADIIAQCLERLVTWADHITIFDTGSVDDSWEIVQDLASRYSQIIPIRKEAVYFSDTRLRGYLFNLAREQMKDGDWFLRVDADEFHHVLPPEFVKTYLRSNETIAYHQYYDFQFTEQELIAWEKGEENLKSRDQPIEERRRFFTPSYYSEPRLCRYRSTMKWPETVSFPFNAGFVAKERLPIRHYPHRDPVQLARRYKLRAIMMADATNRQNWSRPEQHHWSEADWRKVVISNNNPDLKYWEFNQELPHYQFTNHLKPFPKRLVQRLVHSVFLPLLDNQRPAFSDKAFPQPISDAVNQTLVKELT